MLPHQGIFQQTIPEHSSFGNSSHNLRGYNEKVYRRLVLTWFRIMQLRINLDRFQRRLTFHKFCQNLIYWRPHHIYVIGPVALSSPKNKLRPFSHTLVIPCKKSIAPTAEPTTVGEPASIRKPPDTI